MAIKRAKTSYWADFLVKTFPQTIWGAKQVVAPTKMPRFPSLPGASDLVSINNARLDHFFPPKDHLPKRGRLTQDPSADPLTNDTIKNPLSESSPPSPPSAPTSDVIAYLVWKRVHNINPGILLDPISPLPAFDYHPPSLKNARGVILHKQGKASYNSPLSFRKIVRVQMVQKILEHVMTVRLSAIAHFRCLLNSK